MFWVPGSPEARSAATAASTSDAYNTMLLGRTTNVSSPSLWSASASPDFWTSGSPALARIALISSRTRRDERKFAQRQTMRMSHVECTGPPWPAAQTPIRIALLTRRPVIWLALQVSIFIIMHREFDDFRVDRGESGNRSDRVANHESF